MIQSPSTRWPRLVFALSLLAAACLVLGCDDDGDDTPSDTFDAASDFDLVDDTTAPDTTTDDTLMTDVPVDDATDGDTTGDDTADDTTGGGGYRYVRVNDLSPTSDTISGGADIDAVVLLTAGGGGGYAQSLEGYNHGGGQIEGVELDPNEALGPPDAFVGDYTSPDPVCDLDAGYVSLGGAGGYLIVEMNQPFGSGDTLDVLEIGGCTGNDGAEGIAEDIEIQVSASFDGPWVTIGNGTGPYARAVVP